MPFSGFLVSTGRFDFFLVGISGAVGNTLGSLLIYGVGYWGHERLARRFVRKYGKWILFTEAELDKTEKLLHKYKNWVVLGSRVVPGVRTVISLPCGIARLPLKHFITLTFFGSLVWSVFLAWIGFVLGQNWEIIRPVFHKLEAAVVIGIVAVVVWYIYHKIKS